jgi:PAS domain S-box-containing protein
MKQKNNNRRFDDIEIRSKLELLADLQIHQVELQMQNNALKETQQQLEETRDRYADLFDYAPVGYLTLDSTGNILEINLTGCAMLGLERASVVNKPFIVHLAEGHCQTFLHHLKQTFNSKNNAVTELKIKSRFDQEKHVRLESKMAHKTNICRMIMTDIDQLRKTTSFNDALLNENRRLMQNLFTVQEKERRFIVGELHDELGQWISAIYAEAETISNHANKESIIYPCAQSISESTQKMHQVIRKMLHELRPPLLDTLGLKDALLELKKQWCSHHVYISLEFRVEGDLTKLGEQLNITIYRIIQESLNNICSHSDATSAEVCLRRETGKTSAVDMLVLNVKDNGKGYDTNQANPGIGLLGMRERAISAGGKFTVNSSPNNGTQIHASLPIPKNEKNFSS